MFTFTQQPISPAVKTQIDTQLAFFSDLSKQMLESVEKLNKLNVQVAATVFEESAHGAQQLLSAANQNEALSMIAEQTMPAAEKVRAYQVHVENILAETQVSLAKTVETHAPETVRRAEAAVREAGERASNEFNKGIQRQKESLAKQGNPSRQTADRNTPPGVIKTAQ